MRGLARPYISKRDVRAPHASHQRVGEHDVRRSSLTTQPRQTVFAEFSPLAGAVRLVIIHVGVEFACPLRYVGGLRPCPFRFGCFLLGDGRLTLRPRRTHVGLGLLALGFELSVPRQLTMLPGFNPAACEPLLAAATHREHGNDDHDHSHNDCPYNDCRHFDLPMLHRQDKRILNPGAGSSACSTTNAWNRATPSTP